MTTQFWATNWVFWLYFAAWLPFTLLALSYGFGSPWWTSPIGRSLLAVKASFSAVLTVVMTAFIWPGQDWRQPLIFIGIGCAACAGWYQLWTFIRLQHQGRRDHR